LLAAISLLWVIECDSDVLVELGSAKAAVLVVPWYIGLVRARWVVATAFSVTGVVHQRWICPRHALSFYFFVFVVAGCVHERNPINMVPFGRGQDVFLNSFWVVEDVSRHARGSVNLTTASVVYTDRVVVRKWACVLGAAGFTGSRSRCRAISIPEFDFDGLVELGSAKAAVLVVSWYVGLVRAKWVVATASTVTGVFHQRWICPRHVFTKSLGSSSVVAGLLFELNPINMVPFGSGQDVFCNSSLVLEDVSGHTRRSVNLTTAPLVHIVGVSDGK